MFLCHLEAVEYRLLLSEWSGTYGSAPYGMVSNKFKCKNMGDEALYSIMQCLCNWFVYQNQNDKTTTKVQLLSPEA